MNDEGEPRIELGRALAREVLALEVLNAKGSRQTVAECLGGRVVVLGLLRHFGCIGCAQWVHHLAPRAHDLTALGAKMVLIGNGEPAHLAAFVDRHALADKPVELRTEPSLRLHRALDLHRSHWRVLGPRALVGQLRAWGQGFQQGRVQGDGSQQGGAVVVDASGVVRFVHRSEYVTDAAPVDALVGEAMRWAARGERAGEVRA